MSESTSTTATEKTTPATVESTTPAVISPVVLTSSNAMIDERINTWGRVAVSLFVLLLLLIAEAATFTGKIVDPSMLSLLQNLGVLVVGYWVGSSASSVTKQNQLATQSALLANSTPIATVLAPGTSTTSTSTTTTAPLK